MIIAWFSCGATSAVACKMALSMYNNVRIYYIETGSCHPDNVRFLKDCEQWYWNKIRVDFPEQFKEVAEIEREVKATCIKDETGRVYLDELDPCRGDPVTEVIPDCSLFCQIEFQEILDRQTERILKGEMGINEVA